MNEDPLSAFFDVCNRSARKPRERAQITLGYSTLFPEFGQSFANEYVYGFGGVWCRHGCILGFDNDAVKRERLPVSYFDARQYRCGMGRKYRLTFVVSIRK